MSGAHIDLSLARALAISQEMLDASEKGNLQSLQALDLERMDLLKFFRNSTTQMTAVDPRAAATDYTDERPDHRFAGASAAQ